MSIANRTAEARQEGLGPAEPPTTRDIALTGKLQISVGAVEGRLMQRARAN